MTDEADAIVVGSGINGLVAAAELARAGWSVILLERNAEIGGFIADIIPLIEDRYSISNKPQERAIAGVSMGGLQAIDTGIVHVGYFRWIGAFSPGVISGSFSEEFKKAISKPNKVNEDLLLFDIVTGDKDKMVGKYIAEFEAQLKEAQVRHVYTVIPSGTHSMFVWRPALCSFLEQIFKRGV